MSEKELTFWDHLDELRRVLFRVLGVWFVLAIGYFIAMPYLFDNVILAPCHNDFIFYDLLRWIGQRLDLQDEFFTQEFHVKLVNINLAAPFFVHMSTAFWMSVVTAAPYFFYEIWRFVSPALYPNERKGVRKGAGYRYGDVLHRCVAGVFYGLSADIAFPFHLSIERSHRESNFPELVHRQFHDVGALHGTGIRTAAGDMAAFPAGTGAQDLFAEIPPSCCCHHCYCLGHHYSDR